MGLFLEATHMKTKCLCEPEFHIKILNLLYDKKKNKIQNKCSMNSCPCDFPCTLTSAHDACWHLIHVFFLSLLMSILRFLFRLILIYFFVYSQTAFMGTPYFSLNTHIAPLSVSLSVSALFTFLRILYKVSQKKHNTHLGFFFTHTSFCLHNSSWAACGGGVF